MVESRPLEMCLAGCANMFLRRQWLYLIRLLLPRYELSVFLLYSFKHRRKDTNKRGKYKIKNIYFYFRVRVSFL